MKAVYKGITIAQSDATIVVEGNYYFPPEAVRMEYFSESATHTTCPWKGLASYYTLKVDGEEVRDAAWYYPEPKEAARQIKGYVAFYTNKVAVN